MTLTQVEGALLLDIIIRQGATVLKLLAREDEALLVGRDPFLVLDLRFDVVDCVGRLDLESDGFAGQRLHEDLHTATETQDEMEGGLLLDVVIRESATILKLLAGEDETLLIGRNTLLVLDLRFHVVNRVRGLDLERDRFARERLDEDLHTTTETKHYRGVNEKVADLYNTLYIPRWRVDSFWM